MRADRLIAVLLLLQSKGRVTAAQVARDLEISERTARRDLEALGLAGVPVYSSPGRGGGWSLVGGARTDLTGLTVDEARALFLAAGSAVAAAPAVEAALRKLLGALPAPLREGARAAGEAVVVDAASWGRSAPPEPPHLPALQRAVVDGEQVVLGYAGRAKAPSTRTVSPLGLVTKAGVWYLIAGTEAGVRTFRVGRVTAVTPTGAPVRRPDGFDLRAAWEASAGEVEQRRAGARVQALADPSLVPLLRRWSGPAQVAVGEPDPDGRVAVELAGPSVEVLAAQFAGFGHRLEITTPEARPHLRRVADDLRRLYGDP
ncbi:helix-turn-helix transcriptional regulator [Geodermatophilus sp. SYSU D00691]